MEKLELYASENATNHRTSKYELVSEQSTAVFRRAAPFYMAVQTKERPVEIGKDQVNVVFEFGETPSVPKGTKTVSSGLRRTVLWGLRMARLQKK